MSAVEDEILSNKLVQVHKNPYIGLYISKDEKILLSQTQTSYVSIEAFKYSFMHSSGIIAERGVEKFIFDKRSLRAFHQPSMEWYFVEWKQEMFHKYGLRLHRKILPAEVWFRKCVEAGRSEIERKHPENIFDQLDILYTATITEAIAL